MYKVPANLISFPTLPFFNLISTLPIHFSFTSLIPAISLLFPLAFPFPSIRFPRPFPSFLFPSLLSQLDSIPRRGGGGQTTLMTPLMARPSQNMPGSGQFFKADQLWTASYLGGSTKKFAKWRRDKLKLQQHNFISFQQRKREKNFSHNNIVLEAKQLLQIIVWARYAPRDTCW